MDSGEDSRRSSRPKEMLFVEESSMSPANGKLEKASIRSSGADAGATFNHAIPKIAVSKRPEAGYISPHHSSVLKASARYVLYVTKHVNAMSAERQQQLEPFVYQPLQNASRQFRLLILSSTLGISSDGRQIPQGKLVDASTTDHPAYIALSYTWGDPKDTRPMLIEGKHKLINRNAASFLSQMVEQLQEATEESAKFWIDAICINQEDDAEKSQQVQIMVDIFSQANSGTLWLGPASENSDVAMHFMQTTAELNRQVNAVLGGGPYDTESVEKVQNWLKSIFSNYDDTLGPLLDLIHRPWWSRAWVQQEVAVAPIHKTYLCCGNKYIPWFSVGFVQSALSRASDFFARDLRFADGSSRLMEALSHVSQRMGRLVPLGYRQLDNNHLGSVWSLADAFVANATAKAGRMECTLPVDQIYALLAIVKDKEQAAKAITPDYSKSAEEVFMQTASYLFNKEGLRILALSGFKAPSNLGLPSWVTDWTLPWPSESLSWQPDSKQSKIRQPLYQASGKGNEFSFRISNNVLSVSGLQVDTIVADRLFASLCNLNAKPDYGDWHRTYKAFVDSMQEVLDHNTMASAWRVPIADRGPFDKSTGELLLTRAQPHMHESYKRTLATYVERDETKSLKDKDLAYYETMKLIIFGRQPFVSENGLLGLGPDTMMAEDIIFIILGHTVPMVLRPLGGDKYRIVGEAYVYSIMDGEFLERGVEAKPLRIV